LTGQSNELDRHHPTRANPAFRIAFPMPAWQANAPHGPGRMVPDVAGNADPQTGYEILVHGVRMTVGGPVLPPISPGRK
jgi:hypothetical protein